MIHDIYHHLIHERVELENEIYKKVHSKRWIRFVDKYIYVIAAMSIIMTVPQIYDIWIMQNASGVSLISWMAYLVGAIVWLVYGIGHREKVITVTNAIWVFLDLFIVVGIVIYG